MKTRILIILLISLLIGCQPSTERLVKWEYKVVLLPSLPKDAFTPDNLTEALKKKSMIKKDILREHGEQGWELIQLEGGELVFKRPTL